jgi:5'-phosphate synthase pdxT subunit
VKKIGILALQGDYAAHAAAVRRAGSESFEARTVEDIEAAEAMIMPGGESTVIGNLLVRFGLMDALVRRIRGGMPVLGTCAGLILLAARIEGRNQPGVGLLDVEVRRNAYGRQVNSFREHIETRASGAERLEAVFIRAPKIVSLGSNVEILASCRGDPVLVRQDRMIGASFHPEFIPDAAIHRWFLGL